MKGRPLLNGAFGVVKAQKFLPDERPVLRFIMDFRATNAATHVLEGDVRSLTGAPALQHIVLPQGKVLRISADDLVSAFYLFQLPKGWSKLMTFAQKVSWRSLGKDQPGETFVGATVLPMGWSSAVGVLQHAHRRLALRSPLAGGAGLLGGCEIRRDSVFPDLEVEEKMWSLYLDDTNLMEVMETRVAKDLEGKPSEEQERLRKAYGHWGIPVNVDKALVRAQQAEKLGAVVNGELGQLRGAMKRALDSIGLGFWILRQEEVPRKSLQVFLGREVHTMQFRRPLFSVFDYIWKDVSDGGPLVRLQMKSVEEILLAACCQPLRFTDLRATLNQVVTASDASETGGGMVYGNKLTSQGIRDAYAAEEAVDAVPEGPLDLDSEQVVVVFDFFSGIGGLSRALQLAKMKVARLVVVESDAGCRRLHSTRWPGCDTWLDIEKVEKKHLEKIIRETPNITGIVAGGGSPCQGISKLSAFRKHLADPRSGLFFTLKKVLEWVKELAAEFKIWSLRFVENVVGDAEDIKEMSEALDQRPIMMCPSGLSRVRRPRLFWCNIDLEDHGSFSRCGHQLYDEVEFEEAVEPLGKIPMKGWCWPAGEKEEDLRLPTFTRAIPRVKPPAFPAGLESCDDETKKLWERDAMKYPPYTYKAQFLFQSLEHPGRKRVAVAEERERLMGFPTNYTKSLFKKAPADKKEEAIQEVTRCAALGNSFHAVGVACLLDLWLWGAQVRTDPLGAKAIVEQWHQEITSRRWRRKKRFFSWTSQRKEASGCVWLDTKECQRNNNAFSVCAWSTSSSEEWNTEDQTSDLTLA